MLHAICDFCGKDTGNNAMLLTLTPFQNFANHHDATEPYGSVAKPRSFVICSNCLKKHEMPNPYETYSGITAQTLEYKKCLDNYTKLDLLNDTDTD